MKDFREPISDYLQGDKSSKSAGLIEKWLSNNHERKQTLQYIRERLERCHERANNHQPQTQDAYELILQKINNTHTPPKQVSLFSSVSNYYKYAAAILILLVSSFFVYLFSKGSFGSKSYAWEELTTQSGFKDITLEDGTRIWLHHNSALNYPAHFASDHREVSIKGEAFFDVAHEPDRPFVIKTAAKSEIKVMGTSLNVRSYGDEKEEEIAVATGEVMYICAEDSKEEMKLDKGNCAVWHMETNKIETMEETDPNVFSWKDHILTFDNADCFTLEKALERYFGVEIAIKDSSLMGTQFSAKFEDKNLEQILEHFNAEDKVAHEIKKDTCFLWKHLGSTD